MYAQRPTTPRTEIRASTREREATVDQLRAHTVAGRLDLAEYEQRLDAALGAATVGELRAVTLDLPRLPSTAPIDVAIAAVAAAALVTAIVTVVVWAFTGGLFWPVFPIVGTTLALIPLIVIRRAIRARLAG